MRLRYELASVVNHHGSTISGLRMKWEWAGMGQQRAGGWGEQSLTTPRGRKKKFARLPLLDEVELFMRDKKQNM